MTVTALARFSRSEALARSLIALVTVVADWSARRRTDDPSVSSWRIGADVSETTGRVRSRSAHLRLLRLPVRTGMRHVIEAGPVGVTSVREAKRLVFVPLDLARSAF